MPLIHIVPLNDGNQSAEGHYDQMESLPLFYMSDFSVMGLRVSPYDDAIDHLENGDYRLKKELGGIKLIVDDVTQIDAVMHWLDIHRIRCELTDIVTAVYQG